MPNILKYINKNKSQLLVSIIFGLVSFRSLYNHLGLWIFPLGQKFLIGALIFFFPAFISYVFFFGFIWKRLDNFSRSEKIAWVLFSILGGILCVLSLPINIPTPTANHQLEIRVETHGEQGSPTEVNLLEIRDDHGNLLPFDVFEYSGPWKIVGNSLVYSGESPASIKYTFRSSGGSEMYLLFATHPNGGEVTIWLDNQSQIASLREDPPAKTEIYLPVPIKDIANVSLLYGVDAVLIGFCLLLISIIFLELFRRRPRLAMAIFMILNCTMILGLGLYPPAPGRKDLLPIVLALGVLGLWLLSKLGSRISKFWIITPYLISLVGALFFLTDWNTFIIAPDTISYVRQDGNTRPPLYPLFIEAATFNTGYNHRVSDLPENEPIQDIFHPLMNVARAQKATLILAGGFACLSLTLLFGIFSIPVTSLFFVFLFTRGFFSGDSNYILSDTLGQIWLFFQISVIFLFVARKWRWLLPISAICFAGLYLTRNAGIFGAVPFILLLIYAIWVDRETAWKTSLASLALAFMLIMSPAISIYLRTGVVTPSEQYSTVFIPFALQLSQPEDLALMPDEISKQFFIRAREKQMERNKIVRDLYPNSEYMRYSFGINVYDAALPAAAELFDKPSDQNKLMVKAANILIKQHFTGYLQMGLTALRLSANEPSRIKFSYPLGVWPVLTAIGILAIILRGWAGFCGFSLLSTHLAHMVIVSFFGTPIPRYIQATEFLILMALLILIWEFLARLFSRTGFIDRHPHNKSVANGLHII